MSWETTHANFIWRHCCSSKKSLKNKKSWIEDQKENPSRCILRSAWGQGRGRSQNLGAPPDVNFAGMGQHYRSADDQGTSFLLWELFKLLFLTRNHILNGIKPGDNSLPYFPHYTSQSIRHVLILHLHIFIFYTWQFTWSWLNLTQSKLCTHWISSDQNTLYSVPTLYKNHNPSTIF